MNAVATGDSTASILRALGIVEAFALALLGCGALTLRRRTS